HGAQKLFGWFGGHGISGHAQFMRSLEMEPARPWAWVSALGEFVGGLLLVLGLFTPVAAVAISVSMLVATIKVHWPNGVWVTEGGFEYALVLMANVVLFGLVGPGLYSLDAALDVTWPQAVIFVIAIVVGSAGAIITMMTASSQEP